MAGLNDLLSEGENPGVPGLGDGTGGSTNKDLMADARAALSGNWGLGVLGYVLYMALFMSFSMFVFTSVFFVSMVSQVGGANTAAATEAMNLFSSLIQSLVSGAFMVGFAGFFLGIVQEGSARLELLFVGFQRFWKSFGVYFFYSLFIILWTLLFIIPGIIATFRYAMAFFIIADDEDCGPLEAISRSKEMMKGNKWKFFCLNWRFFGWALLAAFFTFGIGYLWLVPYMQTSFAKFYEDVS
jgi:uncharacterized membrane protein